MGFSKQEYWSRLPLPSPQVVLVVKKLPANAGDIRDVGSIPGLGRSPGEGKVYIVVCVSEKAMAPHSSTLAWKIPWMEEPGRLHSMGSLTVRHD